MVSECSETEFCFNTKYMQDPLSRSILSTITPLYFLSCAFSPQSWKQSQCKTQNAPLSILACGYKKMEVLVRNVCGMLEQHTEIEKTLPMLESSFGSIKTLRIVQPLICILVPGPTMLKDLQAF